MQAGEFSGKQSLEGIRKMEANNGPHSLIRSQQERYLNSVLNPYEIEREKNFQNTCNVVSYLEKRARQIKNKIA